MNYRILSQGALDGTCYLYSIMNAYKSLVYPELDILDFIYMSPKEMSGMSKWEYIIRTCPQTLDMLTGKSIPEYILGIKTRDVNKVINNQYRNTITMAFDILANENNQFLVEKISIEKIMDIDFMKSVIILPIMKSIKAHRGNSISNHFICINGRDGDNMHIMCSYSIHALQPSEYFESYDYVNNRYYNNMISLQDINEITLENGKEVIYQISRK